MSFFSPIECQVCKAHLQRIDDLKKEIERLVKERETERAEYKRAIDVILFKENLPTVGQGIQTTNQVNPNEMLAFFDEEPVKDK